MPDGKPFDFGKLSKLSIERSVKISLKLMGLTADVYTLTKAPEKDFETEIYPGRKEPEEVPPKHLTQIKVLVSPILKGLNINTNFISLSDKIEEFMTIITTYQLEEEQELRVHFPDKKIKFRIIAPGITLHEYSQQCWTYECVVSN